jgi:hypothetical protein
MLFGREIDLSQGPFAHPFPKAGRFRLRAIVDMKARKWLDGAISRGLVRPRDVHFALDHLVDASLESPDLLIDVR